MERQLKFEKMILPQIVEQITFYTVAVYLAYKGWGINAYTIAILGRGLAGVSVMYLIQRWPAKYHLALSELKSLLRYGFKFQLNDLLARIKDDLIIVFLGRYISPTQLGYVGWAKRWSLFPYQMSVSNIIAILFPTFSRLQQEKLALGIAMEKALFFISLVIFPILVGMSVMANPLIHLVPHYEKWQPALLSLYWFCINIAFAAMANPVINSLNALGQIRKTLKLMVVMTVMTWGLTPVSVYYFGYQSIAVVSAGVALVSLYAYNWLKPDIRVNLGEAISRQAAAAILMGLVLVLGRDYWAVSWGHFGIGIVGGILVYVGGMWLIGWTKLKAEVSSLLGRR